jgi:hypothetical protein
MDPGKMGQQIGFVAGAGMALGFKRRLRVPRASTGGEGSARVTLEG